jgi:hypothetical protein
LVDWLVADVDDVYTAFVQLVCCHPTVIQSNDSIEGDFFFILKNLETKTQKMCSKFTTTIKKKKLWFIKYATTPVRKSVKQLVAAVTDARNVRRQVRGGGRFSLCFSS